MYACVLITQDTINILRLYIYIICVSFEDEIILTCYFLLCLFTDFTISIMNLYFILLDTFSFQKTNRSILFRLRKENGTKFHHLRDLFALWVKDESI